MIKKSYRLIHLVFAAAALWVSFGASQVACTPKREAALTNLAADKTMCLAKCSASMVSKPMEEILTTCGAECGKPTGDDLQNYKDLIFGQKAGAAAAGAKIPDAPADAGAR